MGRGFFAKPSIAQQLCECHIRKRLALFGSLEDELTAGVQFSSFAEYIETTLAERHLVRLDGTSPFASWEWSRQRYRGRTQTKPLRASRRYASPSVLEIRRQAE